MFKQTLMSLELKIHSNIHWITPELSPPTAGSVYKYNVQKCVVFSGEEGNGQGLETQQAESTLSLSLTFTCYFYTSVITGNTSVCETAGAGAPPPCNSGLLLVSCKHCSRVFPNGD